VVSSGSKKHRAKVGERLDRARAAANSMGDIPLAQIERMSQSSDTLTRLTAAVLLYDEADRGGTIASIIPICKSLLVDGACRWQALNAIANGIPNEPELVWPIIAEFGSSDDADLRMGIAKVLLEHLLETHLEDYFPLVRERALAGDPLFLRTLSSCWFNREGECQRRVKNLLRTARRCRQSG